MLHGIRLITLLLVFYSSQSVGWAQPSLNPVHWTFTAETIEEGKYQLTFSAQMDQGWYIYSQHLDEGGPVPTSFSFDPAEGLRIDGEIQEVGNIMQGYDELFDMNVIKYTDQVSFVQLISLDQLPKTISGQLEYMTCDKNRCLPPQNVEFRFQLE
jgi:hypothetical protein